MKNTTLVAMAVLCSCGLDAMPKGETAATEQSALTVSHPDWQQQGGQRLGAHSIDRVLKDTTTQTALEIDQETVFCSALGYAQYLLKLNVPDLDWLAHFDHRQVGANTPCAAAGTCDEALSPDSIIAGAPGPAPATIRVVLKERLQIDDEARTCTRFLSEDVTVVVRNSTFRHHKEDAAPVPDDYGVCQIIESL